MAVLLYDELVTETNKSSNQKEIISNTMSF